MKQLLMKQLLSLLYALITLQIANGVLTTVQKTGNSEISCYNIPRLEEIEVFYRRSVRLIENGAVAEIRGSAGPEKSVTWRQYYRYSDNLFSEVFCYVLAVEDEIIIYATQNSVIIQDIFDKTTFFVEINEFEEPLAKMVDPIQSAVLSEDLSTLEITYLTGEERHIVRETFNLDVEREHYAEN